MKKIKCKICGFESTNLVSHISRGHKIKIKNYKKLYGDDPLIIYTDEQRKSISVGVKKNYKGSPYTLSFWMNKGYSEVDAKTKIDESRPSNKKYWIKKYGKIEGLNKYNEFRTRKYTLENYIEKYGIKRGNEKYNSYLNNKKKSSSMCKEYWIERGFSENDAINQVSIRQTTFSKDILIDKYGYNKGIKIWKQRQTEWQNTLNEKSKNEIDDINKRKDNSSIIHLQKHHNKNWIDVYFKRNLWGMDIDDKNKIRKIIFKYDNQLDFITNFKNYWEYDYKKIRRILDKEIIKYFYNIHTDNQEQVYRKILLSYGIIKLGEGLYGNRYTLYNGNVYKSNSELEIAKFLISNDIKFEYEKSYGKYKCDFYLYDFDLYIEYLGLSGKIEYDKKTMKKRKYALKNRLNFVFSDNTNFIKEIINGKKSKN